MALEIKLNQKLTQTLAMTPQLRQAIELLQLGRQEYLEVISEELLKNPVLEESAEEEASSSDGRTRDSSSSEDGDGRDNGNASPASETKPEPKAESQTKPEDAPAWGEDNDYDDYSQGNYDYRASARNYSGSDDRPSIEATISYPEGLSSHLLWQLRTMDLREEDRDIAGQIIGNLDRNGYLCSSILEIAESCQRSEDDVESVLKLIQSLDPSGVGARDLRECLLIQLEQSGLGGTLVSRIVSDHLNDLELRRYEVIAKKHEVSVDCVYEAVKTIQKLEPRPGRPFSEESPVYITPDVYVRKVGDEYVISLNDVGVPKLRLNPHYQRLLAQVGNKDIPGKEYLLDHMRSATGLIKSIHRRQQTIFRVTESIMKFQHDFLEHGVAELRPLVLRDVASDVSMHESTISRVTTNKYVHTPQGVFELKFFFTSGLKGGDGEVSSESVRERIRELVANENPRKPLSDQAIVNILKQEGIDIARRTVAKYRESMNILASSRRKKVF